MELSLKTSIIDWPTTSQSNLEYRAKLLKECETNTELQVRVKEACRQNILFWIDCFCWTKDQRKKNDILPFVCYEYQRGAIKDIESHIDRQQDLLIDKSRDMGASWMILYVFMHKWLFEEGSDFRVGSRKEEYVDKLNDIDTLIEKVRFNLKRMPTWMMPAGFNYDDHLGYMRILNPENGNAIIGESANPFFSSGGRRKAILMDEFAKWEPAVAEAAWTATADASPCRVVVSTPVGSGNKFAQLALGTQEKIDRLTLHWTLHPEKSTDAYYLDNGVKIPIPVPLQAFKLWKSGVRVRSFWYDAEAERRKEQDLAQEVDIDYLRSGHVFFDAKALARQREWEYLERDTPASPIPYGKYIKAMLTEVDGKVELREHKDGWMRIFELPKSGFQYTVGSDIAEGLEKNDESFFTVREKWTRNVVAAGNGLYSPDDMAVKLQKVGKFYNNCLVAPENNNHGYSVCSDLKLLDCNLYYSNTKNEKGEVTSKKAGWTTSVRSRPQMLDQLAEEIRKDAIELRDPVIIAQCKTFIMNPKNGKPEADENLLDDGVLATAISGAVIQEHPFKAKPKDAKSQEAVREAQKPMFAF